MPEGDSLHKIAKAMRPGLEGKALVETWLRDRGAVRELSKTRVTKIEAIGKHLVVHAETGYGLRVHLGMKGSVHRYQIGEAWMRSRASAVATLTSASSVYVVFRASQAEVLRTKTLAAHPRIASLGPDLTVTGADVEEAVRRARAPGHGGRAIGEVLLDQRVAAGIGNVYKSEVLFIERVSPFAKVSELDDATLRALYTRASALLALNVRPKRRVTVAPALRASGGPAHYVYGRHGRACLRCRGRIERRYQGDQSRATYFCARCQRVA